jgi:hypothetical protein
VDWRGASVPRVQGVVCAVLELADHHVSHDTTTESAFNPIRRDGTKLTQLAELLTEDGPSRRDFELFMGYSFNPPRTVDASIWGDVFLGRVRAGR